MGAKAMAAEGAHAVGADPSALRAGAAVAGAYATCGTTGSLVSRCCQ